jgi:SAM-dependent methyltransferase
VSQSAAALDFPRMRSAGSYQEQDQWIADAIAAIARREARQIKILEAGCGRLWPLDLGEVDYHLTGADLDPAALQLRLDLQQDLDAAIEGDLCTMALPAQSFDVVYSAYVLEHIRDADVALDNMIQALRPGGLLVLRIPDPDTARGLVTRNSPFWFHVLYYRWVMKRPKAGTPGHAPYPVYYHPVISKPGLQAYARVRGLRCLGLFSDDFVRDGKGVAGLLFRAGARAISWLSFGRFTSAYNDLVYLLEKPVVAGVPAA